MSESTKKRNKYNDLIVRRVAEKWNVTPRFVTMALRKDRVTETAESIVRDYKRIEREIKKVLEK